MIWLIIGGAITIFVTVQTFTEDGFLWGVGSFFISIFLSFIGSLSLCMIIGAIMTLNVTPHDSYESTNLIALQDGNAVTGSFFLGCGSVNDEQYYYYIVQEDLGMKEEKVKAEYSYIQYTTDTPKITTISKDFPHNWYNWFAAPMWYDRYIIYVPNGSVTNNFNVDLKN